MHHIYSALWCLLYNTVQYQKVRLVSSGKLKLVTGLSFYAQKIKLLAVHVQYVISAVQYTVQYCTSIRPQ